MEPDFLVKLLGSMLEQGPLVGFLFYQNLQANKKTEAQEQRITQLHADLLAKQELYLTKTFEQISQNTSALNGLKDVVTVKNG